MRIFASDGELEVFPWPRWHFINVILLEYAFHDVLGLWIDDLHSHEIV